MFDRVHENLTNCGRQALALLRSQIDLKPGQKLQHPLGGKTPTLQPQTDLFRTGRHNLYSVLPVAQAEGSADRFSHIGDRPRRAWECARVLAKACENGGRRLIAAKHDDLGSGEASRAPRAGRNRGIGVVQGENEEIRRAYLGYQDGLRSCDRLSEFHQAGGYALPKDLSGPGIGAHEDH